MGVDRPAPQGPLDRTAVRSMLARYGDRSPEQVEEELGSLELTWLIAEVEQAYGVQLDLDDDRLDAIRTVDDAALALGAVLAAAGAGTGTGTGETVGVAGVAGS
ncbi:acyl carrier protein [Kitasatospora sp. NPDC049285]|uniref:acyl carrier protein n=1 Tax=Kitasatospora sp. NPDC049285 TaxID=3157096 RepID=UPI003433ACF2